MVKDRIKDFINNYIIANQDDILEMANELDYEDYKELEYMISEGNVYESNFTSLTKTVDTGLG